jgi:CheY-like chemotaxis protein
MDREPLVLVVDDDESVRDAFALALADADYRVQVCESGNEGIAAARADRPDLVFLDLNMPGKDGADTLIELAALDPTIRVYIVTAFAEAYMQRLRAARQRGISFQLASKPIAAEQIRMIAAAWLG